MKTLIMNTGLLAEENHNYDGMPPGFEAQCQPMFTAGHALVHLPDGQWQVQSKTADSVGVFELSKQGALLVEFLVARHGHWGRIAWRKFHQRFEVYRRNRSVLADSVPLRWPGSGPWTAVILHQATLGRSDLEVASMGHLQTAIARAFAPKPVAVSTPYQRLITIGNANEKISKRSRQSRTNHAKYKQAER